MENDSKELLDRLAAYMVFLEKEIVVIKNQTVLKRKKFLDSFMVFYDNYIEAKKKYNDSFPQALIDKVENNYKKIRQMAFEKDDYIAELRSNLENFEAGLIEIFYIAWGQSKKMTDIDLPIDIKNTLIQKSKTFFTQLIDTMIEFTAEFKERVPDDITEKIAEIKLALKRDFKINIDEEDKKIGPLEKFVAIDSDMILDLHEKIKKMRKSKKKDLAVLQLQRMQEIFKM